MIEVVCLGILVADAIARPVEELPDRGALALVDEISLHGGGCALNTASALARLGLAAAVVGKVGQDPFGDFLLGLLDERRVDRRGVVQDPDVATSATVVLVDSGGERTFLHLPGAGMRAAAGSACFRAFPTSTSSSPASPRAGPSPASVSRLPSHAGFAGAAPSPSL